jgi:ferritin
MSGIEGPQLESYSIENDFGAKMAGRQQDKQQQTMLKVSVLHYRDQSHDEATFLKWYLEEQIPRFIPIAHKHGIDRCEMLRPSLHMPAGVLLYATFPRQD